MIQYPLLTNLIDRLIEKGEEMEKRKQKGLTADQVDELIEYISISGFEIGAAYYARLMKAKIDQLQNPVKQYVEVDRLLEEVNAMIVRHKEMPNLTFEYTLSHLPDFIKKRAKTLEELKND